MLFREKIKKKIKLPLHDHDNFKRVCAIDWP